ncbi:MAG: GTPase domain-containing protein [Candidatus Heimdallarchaeota archaeon]|nr:GTPase domain-containing protein [Candidatus Heimdallarchaeota archaeon]
MDSFLDYIKRVKGVRKILLAGAGGVGKTSLLTILSKSKSLVQLSEDSVDLTYSRTLYLNLITVHASQLVKNYTKDGELIFYDLAGQLDQPLHALRDSTRSTMGAVDLVMLVFDGSNLNSLFDLSTWIEIIKESYPDNEQIPDFILIKNKIELPSNIDGSLIDSFIESELKIIKYFELSAMRGEGMKGLQQWLVEHFFTDEPGGF